MSTQSGTPDPRTGSDLRRCLGVGAAVALGLGIGTAAWADADGPDTAQNMPAPILSGVVVLGPEGAPGELVEAATIALAGDEQDSAAPSTSNGRPAHADTQGPPPHSSTSSSADAQSGKSGGAPGASTSQPAAPVADPAPANMPAQPPAQAPGQVPAQPPAQAPGQTTPPAQSVVPPVQPIVPTDPATSGTQPVSGAPGSSLVCTAGAGGDEECVDAATPHAAAPASLGTIVPGVLTLDSAEGLFAERIAAPQGPDVVTGVRPAILGGGPVAAAGATEPEALTLSAWAQGALAPLPLFAMTLTGLAGGALVVYLQSAPGVPRERRKELYRRAAEADSVQA